MPNVNALVRKRTNEVLAIAKARPDGKIQTYTDADPTYFIVATDPILPDGDKLFNDSTDPVGPRRQLGWAKHYDTATNTVRNSTQAEIDTYAIGEKSDVDDQDAAHARTLLKTDPLFRRAFTGIIALINKTRVDAGLAPLTKTAVVAELDRVVTKDA